jgi:hypothetical protein
MNPQYFALFTAIDVYVRARHRCFVSECDLNQSGTQCVVCVRPTNQNVRPLDAYACKYFRLASQEVENVCKSNTISFALRSRIDRELRAMTDRQA